MNAKTIVIVSIVLVFFGSYAAIIAYAQGPEDILNVGMILYFPSIVMQLAANEGNGIICVDACGPCSAWGTYYMMIDGKCVNGPDGKVCSNNAFGEQWRFFGGKCAPFNPEKIPYEFSNEYLNGGIISCSNVSEYDIVCNTSAKESCSINGDNKWTWSEMYELCFRMQEQSYSGVVDCSNAEPNDTLCNPKENYYVCPSSERQNWSYNDIDQLCYKWTERK